MFESFMAVLWPVVIGGGLWWGAGRCRGRNGKNTLRYSAWGAWLLILFTCGVIQLPFPLTFFSFIIQLAPSAVFFVMAANSLLKEIRSQKLGEYTDAA